METAIELNRHGDGTRATSGPVRPVAGATARRYALVEPIGVALLLTLVASVHAVTVHPDHNWGGDFAQYLNQAKQIAQGTPRADTGYVYSRFSASIGPRAYPPGFPLLLAPVYAWAGLDILAFHTLMLALQIATAGACYVVFRQSLTPVTSGVLTALFSLSPYIIEFRREIRPDMPYTLIILALTALRGRTAVAQGGRWLRGVGPGILVAAAYLVRTTGIGVLGAMVVSDLVRFRRASLDTVKAVVVVGAIAVLAWLVFGRGELSYGDQFGDFSWARARFHVSHYFVDAMRGFWPGPSVPLAGRAMPILWLAAMPLVLMGLLLRLRRSDGFVEVIVAYHVLVIVMWPSTQDLRFLYPVLPFLLAYAGTAVEEATMWAARVFGRPPARLAAAALCGLVLLLVATRAAKVVRASEPVDDGPYSPAAVQMFEAVATQTRMDAVIVFFKPRVMALYAHRHAVAWPEGQPLEVAREYLRSVQVTHAVVKRKGLGAESELGRAVSACPGAFPVVYENAMFAMVEVNTPAWTGCNTDGAK